MRTQPRYYVSTLQFPQQRLRLLQIARVEAFGEPPVNRSQELARLLHLALVAPEACEAHGGAEFPGFGLLLPCDGELTRPNFNGRAMVFQQELAPAEADEAVGQWAIPFRQGRSAGGQTLQMVALGFPPGQPLERSFAEGHEQART